MCWPTCFAQSHIPLRFTSSAWSHVSSSKSISPETGATPALLARKSMRPNSASACSDARLHLRLVGHVHLDAESPLSALLDLANRLVQLGLVAQLVG
jgi:hypothetical protein